MLCVGFNWSRPSKDIVGAELDDQYTGELYYRVQVAQSLTVTPDIQLIINQALNPNREAIWVSGIRVRLSL